VLWGTYVVNEWVASLGCVCVVNDGC